MSSDVWVGALLSVPIGIATGLAVTPVQRWIETRGKDKAIAESRRLKVEYEEVVLYRAHPHLFTHYLLQVAIKTTFYSAAMGVLAGMLYGLAQVTDLGYIWSLNFDSKLVRQAGYVLGQMFAILGSLLILRTCLPALSIWAKVRDFDLYVSSMPYEIRDTRREAFALAFKSVPNDDDEARVASED